VPGDYDGDSVTDIAVWRESTGVWHVLFSSLDFQGGFAIAWGGPGDVPAPAAYHGFRRTDIAVFRPATGEWFVWERFPLPFPFGTVGDIPVPGKYQPFSFSVEITFFRPSTGTWHIEFQAGGPLAFGAAGDTPVPADFSGDGRTDFAVFRASTGTWHVRGLLTLQLGMAGDVPLPRLP
jgi:hypothetical protein